MTVAFNSLWNISRPFTRRDFEEALRLQGLSGKLSDAAIERRMADLNQAISEGDTRREAWNELHMISTYQGAMKADWDSQWVAEKPPTEEELEEDRIRKELSLLSEVPDPIDPDDLTLDLQKNNPGAIVIAANKVAQSQEPHLVQQLFDGLLAAAQRHSSVEEVLRSISTALGQGTESFVRGLGDALKDTPLAKFFPLEPKDGPSS